MHGFVYIYVVILPQLAECLDSANRQFSSDHCCTSALDPSNLENSESTAVEAFAEAALFALPPENSANNCINHGSRWKLPPTVETHRTNHVGAPLAAPAGELNIDW